MKSRRWNVKYIEYVSKRKSCLFTFHTEPQFFWHQGVSMKKKNGVWDEGGRRAARSQITCTTCFLWVTWFHSAQVNKLLSDSLSFPNSCYPSAVANSVWGSHCCLAFFLSKQIAARLLLYNTHSKKVSLILFDDWKVNKDLLVQNLMAATSGEKNSIFCFHLHFTQRGCERSLWRCTWKTLVTFYWVFELLKLV